MHRKTGCLLIAILLAIAACVPQRPTNIPIPMAMAECESPVPGQLCHWDLNHEYSGIWTFNGNQGKGIWKNYAPIAALTVTRFDTAAIVIQRHDPITNQTSVYHGTLQGDLISGTEDWRLPDGRTGSTRWFASIGTAQQQQALAAQQQQMEQQMLAMQQQQQHQAAAGSAAMGSLLMGLIGASAMMGGGGGDGESDDSGPSEAEKRQHQRDVNNALAREYR